MDHDEAIRLDPELVPAFVNRAIAYTLLSKDTQAQQDVDRAVGLGFDRGALESAIKDAKNRR